MKHLVEPTNLEFEGQTITITEFEMAKRRVFKVDFNNSHPQLLITVAHSDKDKKFWTSIPEGRQYDAEQIGKLIIGYKRTMD